MTSQSGGGGGYPGVTSDGTNGLIVQNAFQAGDSTKTVVPDFMVFNGAVLVNAVPATAVDGDPVLLLQQEQPNPAGSFPISAVEIDRTGSIAQQDYLAPTVQINDNSGSVQPVLTVSRGGTAVLSLHTRQSITGALSTVADPAARAVLTSIIAALTGISVATNSTT